MRWGTPQHVQGQRAEAAEVWDFLTAACCMLNMLHASQWYHNGEAYCHDVNGC